MATILVLHIYLLISSLGVHCVKHNLTSDGGGAGEVTGQGDRSKAADDRGVGNGENGSSEKFDRSNPDYGYVQFDIEDVPPTPMMFRRRPHPVATFKGIKFIFVYVKLDDWRAEAYRAYATFCGPDAFCDIINYNRSYDKDLVPQSGVSCLKCSCDEDCGYYRDCCVDTEMVTSENYTITSCVAKNPKTCRNKQSDTIHVFDKCPSETRNTLSGKLCANRQYHHIHDRYLPVTSRHNNRTYANKHCAECNGVTSREYTHWSANIKCEYSITSQLFKEDCCLTKIESPFDEHVLKPCTESEYVMRDCRGNMHSIWNLEILCRTFNAIVRYNGKLFGNIYCVICNEEFKVGSGPDGRTGPIPPPTPLIPEVRVTAPPPPLPRLTMLFMNQLKRVGRPAYHVTQIPPCNPDKVYDIFERKCRAIQCSWHRIYENGKCTKNIRGYKYINYIIHYALKPKRAKASVSIRSLKYIVHQHFYRTWSIVREVIDSFSSQVVVLGKVNGSRPGVDLFNVTVFQEWKIYQTQHNVNKNERLLLSTFGMDSQKLFTLRGDAISCSVETIRTPAKYEPGNIILTNGKSCSFVSYRTAEVSLTDISRNIRKVIDFNISISTTDFVINPDKWRVELCVSELLKINKQLSDGTMVMRNKTKNNITWYWIEPMPIVFVDKLINTETHYAQGIVTVVCCSLSLIALFVTFVTYCLFAELRTAPGYNTMAMIAHLFLSQLMFLTAIIKRPGESEKLCAALGLLIHYLWLCTFAWMTVCAFHMHSVFTRFRPPSWTIKRFICYIVTANGVPVVIVAACVVYHATQDPYNYIGYGGLLCFLAQNRDVMLVFIIAPLALMIVLNTVLFGRTVYFIRKMAANATQTLNKADSNHIGVYFKLSFLLGLTWALGFFLYIDPHLAVVILFYLFNGLQGVFIFFAYCCNRRTYKNYRKLFSRAEPSRPRLGSDTKSTNAKTASTTLSHKVDNH